MDLGLKGKVALVTGASRGIGNRIALALAADRVHRATADAAMVIQEAADEAALAMKKPPPRPMD